MSYQTLVKLGRIARTKKFLAVFWMYTRDSGAGICPLTRMCDCGVWRACRVHVLCVCAYVYGTISYEEHSTLLLNEHSDSLFEAVSAGSGVSLGS